MIGAGNGVSLWVAKQIGRIRGGAMVGMTRLFAFYFTEYAISLAVHSWK